jgi:CTP:molybdopterin cytidylyltransferase MocA
MTVAAVILAASPESAVADVEGQSRVRRIADAAWSGGALPIVVVSFDPDGAVAASLAGAEVTLAEPVPLPDGMPVRQMARGMDVAASLVNDLSGAFIWPAGMVWVGPETITSMIEAHGMDRSSMLRPAYEGDVGWPVLLPHAGAAILASVALDRMPDEILADLETAGLSTRAVEVGDPGVTHDARVPRDQLPAYVGPTEPTAQHRHEWGAALADAPEDAPIEGPAIAPYEPAAGT